MESRGSCVRLAVLLLVATPACLNSPRDRQELANSDAIMPFSGYINAPNETVTLRMYDHGDESWDARYSTSSSTSGNSVNGTTWYHFYRSVRLPYGARHRKYWDGISRVDGQRRVQAKVMATSPRLWGYTTYDINADACINSQSDPIEIISNCRDPKSPVARVRLNCGKPGQDCCHAYDVSSRNSCDTGRRCGDDDLCSVPSGNLGQPCHGNRSCNGDLVCLSDVCRVREERLPTMTLDVRIFGCSSTSYGEMWTSPPISVPATGEGPKTWVDLGTGPFYLSRPANLWTSGSEGLTYGITPEGIGRVNDITELSIGSINRDWCMSAVELYANEQLIFRGERTVRFLEGLSQETTFTADTMRAQWAQRISCAAPPRLSGESLRRKVAGVIGHTFVSEDDLPARFDNDSYVTTQHIKFSSAGYEPNPYGIEYDPFPGTFSQLLVRSGFEASYEGLTGTAHVEFELGFSCNEANGIGISMSDIYLRDIRRRLRPPWSSQTSQARGTTRCGGGLSPAVSHPGGGDLRPRRRHWRRGRARMTPKGFSTARSVSTCSPLNATPMPPRPSTSPSR